MFGFKQREKDKGQHGDAGGPGLGFHPEQYRAMSQPSGAAVKGPGLGFHPGRRQAPDSIPAMVAPGEFILPPDTVHAMGGKEALQSVVDATHTPAPVNADVPMGFHPQMFFANGGAPEDQPRKNSFGDAAAASANPGVAQQPATTPKPNFFPGNSPDAGAAIYDGIGPKNGFGSSDQLVQGLESYKQNVPPAPQVDQRMGNRAAANAPPLATAPTAPPKAAGLDAPWWSREYATAAGMSDKSGLQLEADRAAKGAPLNIAQDDWLKRVAYTGTTNTPTSAKPGYGPASADFAGPPASAAGYVEADGRFNGPPLSAAGQMTNIGGGIERIDRPGHSTLYTDNKDPMMAGFLGRAAGGPTKEVISIMQRMSDQSDAQRANRFQAQDNAAQFAREVQQAQAINAAGSANAWNVQNRMDQEKYLRKLDVKASSTTHAGERLVNLKAYNEATKADAAARQGSDAGSVARTQADAARYGYDTGAATSRYRTDQDAAQFGQTQGMALSKLAMEREAQGFQTRAAAQQEQLRDQLLDPSATPEQRKVAQRSLAALAGKTAADRMQTVNLPDTTTEMGGVVRGGQALVRTLEDGTVEQVPIGGRRPLTETPATIAIRNNANMSREQKAAALAKLGH